MATVKVLVTGAAGQIGYSLCQMIASGAVFGPKQPLDLILLDIPVMKDVMDGVVMELRDCAYTTLRDVIATCSEEEAFKDIDAAFLVGAMPRKEGMERKDLLAANVKIFKSQGAALDKFAKKTVKVLVVGNPANTNAFITSKYAPSIPAKNIAAMTRLDHNRALAQVAVKSGVPVEAVRNVIIWGNHSATQYPDVSHATVVRDGKSIDAVSAVNDQAYLEGPFISMIQKRGAEIIKMRKLSSAMSAAKAACDHMHDWFHGTPEGVHVSMAVPSDGSYGVTAGIVYSFPVTIDAATKDWKIVQGLAVSDFARGKMDATLKELEAEKADALAACA